MPIIDPMAVVDQHAEIADDVKIGPFCTVGPDVKIGAGTELVAHCLITGHTTLGENNKLFPFVALGCPPQDLDWEGHKSFLKIGSGNYFREGFTAHPGTKADTSTTIGDNCYFMNNTHVAHNCIVGNNVIMVNGALAGGYSELHNNVVMSGNTAVHQFCRVGRIAMIGGCTPISKDLPPFMMCFSKTNTVSGLNLIGLKRNGVGRDTIRALKNLHKIFFRSDLSIKQAISEIEADPDLIEFDEVREFIAFVKTSKRGILSGRATHPTDDTRRD